MSEESKELAKEAVDLVLQLKKIGDALDATMRVSMLGQVMKTVGGKLAEAGVTEEQFVRASFDDPDFEAHLHWAKMHTAMAVMLSRVIKRVEELEKKHGT